MTAAARPATSVGAILAVIHRGWTQRMTPFLTPALNQQADVWTRWGAARYASDEFGDRFRLECRFAESLEILLTGDAAGRLRAARRAVERSRKDLMAAGRRANTSAETAKLARFFTEDVARWCSELELATEHVAPGALPRLARQLLARLQVAHALGR